MRVGERVLEILTEGPATAYDVGARLDMDTKLVAAHLTYLAKKGKIHSVGHRKYGPIGKPCRVFAITTP